MDKERIIEGLDNDGNTVKVLLKTAGPQEYRDSQIEYNKAFRKALDSGALLRQKLTDFMEDQGIWNEAKQKQNDEFVAEINAKETILKSGGIKLSEAREIALELRGLRFRFREFLAERNQLDQNSVEGQADNARFSELVRLCMLNPNTKQPYFQSQKDYDSNADQPWVVQASGELANMIYGLDPDYDNRLTENKFLKEFEFVNDDLRLVNEAGHLISVDGDLIDEDGRYVAYRTPEAEKEQDLEQRYYVNKSGEEVIKIEESDGEVSWVTKDKAVRKPFLDDEGNEIITAKKEDVEKEEDLVAEKPKRTRKKASPKSKESSTDK
jgi:hypothetical protein